jgi:hypothetical protein
MIDSPGAASKTIITSAVAGALVAAIVNLLAVIGQPDPASSSSLIMPFLFAFFFAMIPSFLVALLIVTSSGYLIVQVTKLQWIRWLFLPLAGCAIGFALPLALGLIVGTPKSAAIGGLVGGAVSAFMWTRLPKWFSRGFVD